MVRQSYLHRADFATHHLQGKRNANPIQNRREGLANRAAVAIDITLYFR